MPPNNSFKPNTNRCALGVGLIRVLSLVFDQGYEPYGYFIVAKDRTAHPREIAETHTSFVLRLQLERLPDGSIFAGLRDRIPVN